MNKRNRLSILRRARLILADRSRWTIGTLRRGNIDGTTQFCVLGACEEAVSQLGLKPDGWYDAYQLSGELGLDEAAARAVGRRSIVAVNDNLGYEKTMKALDEAIMETKKVTRTRAKVSQ